MGLPSSLRYCGPQSMCRAARSMAPRATKYDRASSTLVSVRSVSARTLLATASPMADRAAVSHSTINSADPFRDRLLARAARKPEFRAATARERLSLWLIVIIRPWSPVHMKRNRHRADVQIGWRKIERRHLD